MSGTPHARYEELVVGHALSALEPEDEQVLLQHLPSCAACERELVMHQETLAQLAHVGDQQAPPPGLWDSIRSEVVAESGPGAFPVASEDAFEAALPAAPAGVVDLAAARTRRRALPGRAARWASVAAGVVLVAGVSVGATQLVNDRQQQGGISQRLQKAVESVESGPGQTVPLAAKGGGKAVAVALVQDDRVSLIVDGIAPNDPSSSVYVLWGQSGAEPTRALATFDVDGSVDVVRDLVTMPAGTAMPQLFVITKEAGRTAPAVAHGAALATGRMA